ncbi:MAG TPA: leucyl/phenylalanyl-tRNA--protein transferase [Chitinophagaceae bacterium]
MPLYALDNKIWFPPAAEAMDDGLLAFGGDLSVERLLLAYRNGIFPWFDGGIPLWWSPDPRCVIYPAEIHVSHSMKQLLKKNTFELKINTDFRKVIENCREVSRKGQPGTWISDEIIESYCRLHELGYAQCAAVYRDGEIIGGLYGIRLQKVFCGESMFSKVSNASKYAFISYARVLAAEGVELIDCQIPNPHLESLGARMIPREEFLGYLTC